MKDITLYSRQTNRGLATVHLKNAQLLVRYNGKSGNYGSIIKLNASQLSRIPQEAKTQGRIWAVGDLLITAETARMLQAALKDAINNTPEAILGKADHLDREAEKAWEAGNADKCMKLRTEADQLRASVQ